MSLLYNLVQLEMFIKHVLPSSCYRLNILQNLAHLNCSPKFARFESSCLFVGIVATESVQYNDFDQKKQTTKLCVFSLHVLYALRLPDLYFW